MSVTGRIAFAENTSYLRLGTLVRLRWMAVAGQTAAVLIVHFGLAFPLPLVACLAVIAFSAGLNILLGLWFPVGLRLSDRAATALLAFDILQLSALLFLTGGLANPFSMMFLAPVMISAAALPPWRTVALGVLAVVAASALGLWSMPLPWGAGEPLALPSTYRVGVWLAILLGVAFLGVYAWRVTQEARELAQALTATEFVLAREQHLSQLDGLAAAAAHELGTPLATIALVAKELDRNGPKEGLLAEDIALLRQQVERCRGILGKLTSLGNEPAGPLGTMTLSLLIEEVASPHRPFDVEIGVTTSGKEPEPTCRRNPGLIYGLGNLIENAVDFALNSVNVTAWWDAASVRVEIVDDGPGFPGEILGRIGEPYLSGRGTRRAKAGEGGMGLGLFIAKSLLERSGATLVFGNAPGGGARVTVTWPRHSFERGFAQAGPMETSFQL
ncbi:MAG: ActS/PrrB/RegB family redox-sensitive histidine kinase [Alsobacter sp.]